MRRSRFRYFIEVIIHVLFWAGVYYALEALTISSFSVVVNIGTTGMQRINGVTQFGNIWVVFGFLLLLFYSNSLWLFKKVIRYKSGLRRVAVVAGWFVLILTVNYLVVDWRRGIPEKTPTGQHVESLAGAHTLEPPPGDSLYGEPHLVETRRVQTHLAGPQALVPLRPFSPDDNWLRMQIIMAIVFLAVLAVAIAEFFIREWIRNDLTRSQAEAHQFSTELKFLRSQVNPHFLFNTLNNLFSMAQKKGNDELADGISKLSGMMRYMLYESNTEKVYLQKEIEYLKSYIALNKLRYADNEVAVNFSHPPAAAIGDVQIAPMLFIPFLENAFKHGVSIGNRSDISVTIGVDEKMLTFTCENTDHSAIRKPEEEKSGIGLANVKRHLELVYGGRQELRTQLEDGKYSVYLQIDLA